MPWEIAFAEPGRALPVETRSNIKFQGMKTLMNESCECPYRRQLFRFPEPLVSGGSFGGSDVATSF
jgi:hypothetical protein